MKTPLSSSAPNSDAEEFVNRKLIRPSLPKPEVTRMSDGTGAAAAPAREPEPKREKRAPSKPAFSAGEQTHAENFYYQKQMQSQTPMTVVLKNGETVQGVIEWYDRACIKLARNGRGSMVIYKSGIRYLHKTTE